MSNKGLLAVLLAWANPVEDLLAMTPDDVDDIYDDDDTDMLDNDDWDDWDDLDDDEDEVDWDGLGEEDGDDPGELPGIVGFPV